LLQHFLAAGLLRRSLLCWAPRPLLALLPTLPEVAGLRQLLPGLLLLLLLLSLMLLACHPPGDC
jgi:hypothetical protein